MPAFRLENALTGESTFYRLPDRGHPSPTSPTSYCLPVSTSDAQPTELRRSARETSSRGQESEDFLYGSASLGRQPWRAAPGKRVAGVVVPPPRSVADVLKETRQKARSDARNNRQATEAERLRLHQVAKAQRAVDRAAATVQAAEARKTASRERKIANRETRAKAKRQNYIASISPRLKERLARQEGPRPVAGLPTPQD